MNRKRRMWSLSCALLATFAIAATHATLAQENDADATPDAPEPFVAPEGFFPISMWDSLSAWGDKHMRLPETLSSTRECGFTMSGFVDTPEQLALVRKNGLKCLWSFELEVFSDEDLTEEEFARQAAKLDATIKEGVEATKNDPDVLGYLIVDEPSPCVFRSIAVAREAIRKYAPGKLAYVNLYPGYAGKLGDSVDTALQSHSYEEYVEKYVRTVRPQFLSYDDYMVEVSEDARNPQRFVFYFTDLFTIRKIALKYDIPFWFIASSLSQLEESSPPTLARYAYQAYTALAAGAQGITWFLYFPYVWNQSPVDYSGHKTLSWTYLRDVNEQLRIVGTYLMDYRSTNVGITPLFTKEDYEDWPELPEPPQNVLVNLRYRFSKSASQELAESPEDLSRNGDAINPYGFEPKIMVGEFEQKNGDSLAALAVNLNFGTSLRVFFDPPEGYKTVKALNPVDGSEEIIADEARKAGLWILPGHGRLFVMEKGSE